MKYFIDPQHHTILMHDIEHKFLVTSNSQKDVDPTRLEYPILPSVTKTAGAMDLGFPDISLFWTGGEPT